MKLAFRKPYFYATVIIFLLYLILAIALSGFYNTIPLILTYANSINWFKLGLSIVLSLIIGLLVAVNSVYFYIKYNQRKKCKEAGAVATIGALGGLAVGVCPLCVTGLFPLILSLLGISFSFASLPFQGIEVQILVILLLAAGYRMMAGR